MYHLPRARTVTAITCVGLLGWIGAACGEDAGADAPAPTTSAPATHAGHHATVTIDGVDYGFANVPASVPAGTKLGFRNTSSVELHELVAFRVDSEVPLDQLLSAPPAELEATLGAPVTVMLQPPGAPEAIVAVGDGTLTEPGRYVLLCFIPIGADPGEYLAAVEAAGGGKPEGVAGGPPHFTAGMVAELTVT
jgi:plastocyanin